jgi:hypothetical protein
VSGVRISDGSPVISRLPGMGVFSLCATLLSSSQAIFLRIDGRIFGNQIKIIYENTYAEGHEL